MVLLDIQPFYYYIILYSVNLLIPIIPAVIVYNKASNEPISAEGTLSNISFKTSGALAAYVIVLCLGYWVISSAKDAIPKLTPNDVTWRIKGNIKFKDYNTGKLLDLSEASSFLNSMQIYINPKLSEFNSNLLKASIPESFIKQQDANIYFKTGQNQVNILDEPIVLSSKLEDMDNVNKILDLHDIVLTFRRVDSFAIQDSFKINADLKLTADPPPANSPPILNPSLFKIQ